LLFISDKTTKGLILLGSKIIAFSFIRIPNLAVLCPFISPQDKYTFSIRESFTNKEH
jgi:hypothetical protein